MAYCVGFCVRDWRGAEQTRGSAASGGVSRSLRKARPRGLAFRQILPEGRLWEDALKGLKKYLLRIIAEG